MTPFQRFAPSWQALTTPGSSDALEHWATYCGASLKLRCIANIPLTTLKMRCVTSIPKYKRMSASFRPIAPIKPKMETIANKMYTTTWMTKATLLPAVRFNWIIAAAVTKLPPKKPRRERKTTPALTGMQHRKVREVTVDILPLCLVYVKWEQVKFQLMSTMMNQPLVWLRIPSAGRQ